MIGRLSTGTVIMERNLFMNRAARWQSLKVTHWVVMHCILGVFRVPQLFLNFVSTFFSTLQSWEKSWDKVEKKLRQSWEKVEDFQNAFTVKNFPTTYKNAPNKGWAWSYCRTKLVHNSTWGSPGSVGTGESDPLDLFPMAPGQIMIFSGWLAWLGGS